MRSIQEQILLLTTTLVIGSVTQLVPLQLITNQLFDASRRFMIITDIIVIGKVIQKFLHGASTGSGFQVQQGIITATIAVDGLKGFAIGGQVLPMTHDPFSQGGGLRILGQGQGIAVHHLALVVVGPERQPMLPRSMVGVGVDDVGLRVGLERGLGQTIARHRLIEMGRQDRIVSSQIIQLHVAQGHLFHGLSFFLFSFSFLVFFNSDRCCTRPLRSSQSPSGSQTQHTRARLYWCREQPQILGPTAGLPIAWG